EAYALFLAALESVQLTVEPLGRWGFRIVNAQQAKNTNIPFYKDGERAPNDKRYVTKMVRLENAEAEAAMGVLNQMKSPEGLIIPYQNSLFITDQAVMIDRLVDVLKEIDVPVATAEKIWMLRVKNTSATEMA